VIADADRTAEFERRYLLAGLLTCGTCRRRMEPAWSNGSRLPVPSRTHSAVAPDPGRPKNAYIREDRTLEHLPALHLLLTRAESPQMRRRRTRHGIDVRAALSPQDAIQFFRENQIALIYDQATGALRADKSETAKTIIKKAS
jgi:hypothetical protein